MKNHSYKNVEYILLSFLCSVGVAIALMVVYYSSDPVILACLQEIVTSKNNHGPVEIGNQVNHPHEINSTKHADTDTDPYLAELLRKAAMDDKTVIMTEVNGAWVEPNSLFDLFLDSFRQGEQIKYLLNHLIVVAVDPKAFDKCKSVHPYCYHYKVDGVNFTSEKKYLTEDYLTMMWTRNRIQQSILKMGYNFLFTDADIMWFRNPFRHISVIAQITIACDWYYGDPDHLGNNADGGFIYVKATNRTIQFCHDWYEGRVNHTGKHEQQVFEILKWELSARHKVKIRFLDTSYIGGLCEPKIDFSKLCTFEANCREGLESKLNETRNILAGWKKYKLENKHH